MSKYTQAQRADSCVLPLEQAVYQTCVKNRGLLGKIAEIYGISYNTLALQVNPNRTCHTLAPHTIELVLEHATIETKSLIMNSICTAHGNAAWFVLPNASNGEQGINDIADLSQKFADMVKTSLDAYADTVITPDEYSEIEQYGYALIAQIKTTLENCKKNMESHHDSK